MQEKKSSFISRYVGDKAFYKMIFAVTVPIMIQNGISNFVSMLDNIMVGRIGTEQMSGISIVNQLIFIYFLCIWGGMGGIGIFTAQYYGNNDEEGIRATMRAKLLLGIVLSAIVFVILAVFGKELIGLYLSESEDGADLALTMESAESYLWIIFLSFPAFTVLQVYASTQRGCGETVVPMKAGIVAVLTNLLFNWLLIYGIWIFPEMGVRGAAVATVISRYVEMSIVVLYMHRHKERNPYIVGLYKTMRIGKDRAKRFALKGAPLLVNEALWSIGMSVLLQCYSTRGLSVIAGFNISNTLYNMMSIVYFSMGDAVAIIVGQLLGASRMEEAVETDRKIIAFGIAFSVFSGLLMVLIAPYFPLLYNTSDEVRATASTLIRWSAVFAPMQAFCHCAYFTLRSGGQTGITFLFDSGFTWLISVPLAFVLSRFTPMGAIMLYVCVNSADIIKVVVGYILVKKQVWVRNIVT